MSNELLQQIEMYKREDGSYDVRRMEKAFGIESSLDKTFSAFFGGDEVVDDDPRIALAVEINNRMHDDKKAAETGATQDALNRATSDTGTQADWLLLVKRGLAVAEYNDPDSNAPTGAHLRGFRDIDGNIYSDQAGIEEKPGRL